MNVELLKSYIEGKYIIQSIKEPASAFRILKWILSANIPSIARLVGVSATEFSRYITEIRLNKEFDDNLYRKLEQTSELGGSPGGVSKDQAFLLYAITRALKPSVFVETGVANGVSTAFILRALEDNRNGVLLSIDLPGKHLPRGKQPGWIIPDELRHRWTLILGKSCERLSEALERLKQIDIFMHDSEHSYENMKWEYQTAWAYLEQGGLLLSHDVKSNQAFPEFCKSVEGESLIYGTFGVIIKRGN